VRNDYDKAFNVNGSEMVISADLGSSSNYSNEFPLFYMKGFISHSLYKERQTLSAEVGKGSLRLAIMQRLVGPKYPVKTIKTFYML